MFFRRKQATAVIEVGEDESTRRVHLALSTLDVGIQRAREARQKARKISSEVVALVPSQAVPGK